MQWQQYKAISISLIVPTIAISMKKKKKRKKKKRKMIAAVKKKKKEKGKVEKQ